MGAVCLCCLSQVGRFRPNRRGLAASVWPPGRAAPPIAAPPITEEIQEALRFGGKKDPNLFRVNPDAGDPCRSGDFDALAEVLGRTDTGEIQNDMDVSFLQLLQ